MRKTDNQNNSKGQATIEFTFAMVVIALVIFGLIKVYQWTGMDYAEHAWDREYFKDGSSKPPLITSEDGTIEQDNPMRTKRLNAFTRTF